MYMYALCLNIRHSLYKKTVFPLLLILNGGLNHLLILSARWIFLNDSYGMSSRYELQYQMGILGILLTFALAARAKRRSEGVRPVSSLTGRAGALQPGYPGGECVDYGAGD